MQHPGAPVARITNREGMSLQRLELSCRCLRRHVNDILFAGVILHIDSTVCAKRVCRAYRARQRTWAQLRVTGSDREIKVSSSLVSVQSAQ